MMNISLSDVLMVAVETMCEHSEKIAKLADLEVSPLAPCETIDDRRHKIASLGLKLANTFTAFDTVMMVTVEEAAVRTPDPKIETEAREADPNAN